jgi:hypothetical protein
MAMELLTFTTVSRLFSNLRDPADVQRIAQHFGWPFPVLKSWFRSLADLRNSCAHHMRVWNRVFGTNPAIPKKPPKNWVHNLDAIPLVAATGEEQFIDPQRRLYMQLVAIQSLMRVVCPKSRWAERLVRLLERNPQVHCSHGFSAQLKIEPLWCDAVEAARRNS